jgi:hypothetical protein
VKNKIDMYLEVALDMAYAKPFNVHQLKDQLRSCTCKHIYVYVYICTQEWKWMEIFHSFS